MVAVVKFWWRKEYWDFCSLWRYYRTINNRIV